MNEKSISLARVPYFAAANGYSGFRSYFNQIFNPKEYEAIYILKGGPGTGKSTFMKRMLEELGALANSSEEIHCSSDPRSLDGIIVRKADRCIAVIDGTAPHSTDPILPGAVDKIVNLGEHWHEAEMSQKRERIQDICEAKSTAYQYAYDYLSIAGEITKKVDKTIASIYGDDSDVISSLFHDKNFKKGKTNVRLLTAYGKDGLVRLNSLPIIAKKLYSVVGVYGSECIFMSRMLHRLEFSGYDYTVFPSALDDKKVYALFIPDLDLAFVAERLGCVADENVIDTARFLDQKRLAEERDRLEFLWREREAFLWSSADQFKRASDEHFKLEEIYSNAMDFSKIDAVFNVCLADIKKKLLL